MKKAIKVFWVIAIFCTNTLIVNAAPTTYDRQELDNMGVNKDWTITESNKDNVLRTPAVNAEEKIYDFAELLTDEEEQMIKSRIDEFIEKTKMDMVIVTASFNYYNDSENEDYAADFYDYNDFGMNFENNSGVLLLRNANPEDPYYDMYTFGNAQLYFNQYRYDSVLDGIYDNLHSQNYVVGFNDFISRSESFILSGKPSDMINYYVDEKGYLQKYPETYHIPWSTAALISVVVTAIVMIVLIRKNKMIMKATLAGEYLNKNSIKISNRKDVFLHSHTSSYTVSSDSGGGGGGGHSSHSGSSGGGHSSGGGRHG